MVGKYKAPLMDASWRQGRLITVTRGRYRLGLATAPFRDASVDQSLSGTGTLNTFPHTWLEEEGSWLVAS